LFSAVNKEGDLKMWFAITTFCYLFAEQKFVETDLNVQPPTVLRFLQKYKTKRSRTFPAM
jgi:hypothetical protein